MKPDLSAERSAFGALIRDQRVSLGRSMREVAKASSVGVATLQRAEAGTHEMGVFAAYRVCLVLGVSVDVLLTIATRGE